MALQGTTRAYRPLDNMAQHSQDVQPLHPAPGTAQLAEHIQTLSQGCPYLSGCSITGHKQGQGEQQQHPWVPMVVVAMCGA